MILSLRHANKTISQIYLLYHHHQFTTNMDKIDRFFIVLNIWVIAIVLVVHSCSINSLENQLDQIRLSIEQESSTQLFSPDSLSTNLSDTNSLTSEDIDILSR